MKKKVYKQLDIAKAIKNIDLYIEPENIENDISDKINIFSFVNDIRKNKNGDLLEDESNESIFNSYMILQFLSMKESDVGICNLFNKYLNILSKKQLYFALICFIERDSNFYKFISKSPDNNEYYEYIIKFFNCSLKEAKLYYDMFGETWALRIKNKYVEERVV